MTTTIPAADTAAQRLPMAARYAMAACAVGAPVFLGVAAPVWAGIALIVAPWAMPAGWFAGSTLGVVAAWAALAVGFAGCALVLLREGHAAA